MRNCPYRCPESDFLPALNDGDRASGRCWHDLGSVLAIGALALTMGSVLAEEQAAALVHQCTRDDEKVRVEVVAERLKGELPCRVVLIPPAGAPEILWRVQFERGMCVNKADRKRWLLETDGWHCETEIKAPWAKVNQGDQPGTEETAAVPTVSDDDSLPQGITEQADSRDLETLLFEAGSDQHVSLSLEESVSLALRNNRDIEGGYLSRVRDVLGLEQAEDQFRPDLTIDGGPDWDNTGGLVGDVSTTISTELPTGGDISLSWDNRLADDIGTATVSGELSQPLLRGAGLGANLADLRAARIDFDIGKLALEETVTGTITQVIIAHRSLNLAQIEIDVATRALKRAKEQKRVSQKLFEAGRIPRLDLVQNNAEIATREVDLASTDLALEDARRNLLQLLDIDTAASLVAEDSTTDRVIEIDAETALAIAFDNRPDFLRARLDDQAIRLGLEIARSEERWGLDAVIGADYQDNLYSNGDRFADDQDVDYRAGLRLNIPFGDVGRRQSVDLAKLDIKGGELSLIELRNSIETEITSLIANIGTLNSQKALAERAEALAEDQLEAERAKFSRGLSSTLDVISLEDALIDAQRATFLTKVDYSNSLTELDQALGTTLTSWAIDLKSERR